MIVVFLVLILLAGLVIVNNKLNKSFLFPPFIFSVIWFFVIFIYVIFKIFDPKEMDSLHNNTLVLVALMNLAFTFGGFYIHLNGPPARQQIKFSPSKVPEVVNDIILLTSIITLVLLIIKARDLVADVPAQNFYIALRYQLTAMRLTYGILDYFLVFGLFASLYRFYTFETYSSLSFKGRIKLILAVLISIALLILSTGRTYFFFYFISVFITFYLKGQLKTKYIRIFSIASVVVFIVIGVVLSKGGNISSTFGENLKSSFYHFIAYLEGPILAFDRFYNSDFEYTYGQNAVRFIVAVLYETGIISSPPVDVVKEYVFVPYPTNVYTAFYQYIMDFGMIGCLVFFFLLGLVHTYMFNKSRNYGNHFKMLTSYSYFPLFMVFFQDQYFTLLSFWVQLWFYSFIVLRLISIKRGEGE